MSICECIEPPSSRNMERIIPSASIVHSTENVPASDFNISKNTEKDGKGRFANRRLSFDVRIFAGVHMMPPDDGQNNKFVIDKTTTSKSNIQFKISRSQRSGTVVQFRPENNEPEVPTVHSNGDFIKILNEPKSDFVPIQKTKLPSKFTVDISTNTPQTNHPYEVNDLIQF
ncbi:hypothetical protein TVAG_041720 [Trichomonas vaginalis G3]|uniref:Uncharacterized protein n=1 Tax=Trichomonas vaginalis (strain ATCC PRA-98 / G3) TaxID=412133 RepID=A2FEW6_TRIV3|nr:hypothetical protein TVAGG3_0702840 [Trichomonas vaginalis G3]EAX96570.1 hypothetical protein TVAG_041720 [Trichomonas vaginalis G3]KAI5509355.1 hypothetical protein TVAGG3_0702840 [Trichomonas vaginalis G3]|eukprot:XP_001309500.1 hypothetical protein [Trichomonas vaginalis G3]